MSRKQTSEDRPVRAATASSGEVVAPVTSTRPVAIEEAAETVEGEGFIVDEPGAQFHMRGTIISTTE